MNIELAQLISFSEIVCYITHGLCHSWHQLVSFHPQSHAQMGNSSLSQVWFLALTSLWTHSFVPLWSLPHHILLLSTSCTTTKSIIAYLVHEVHGVILQDYEKWEWIKIPKLVPSVSNNISIKVFYGYHREELKIGMMWGYLSEYKGYRYWYYWRVVCGMQVSIRAQRMWERGNKMRGYAGCRVWIDVHWGALSDAEHYVGCWGWCIDHVGFVVQCDIAGVWDIDGLWSGLLPVGEGMHSHCYVKAWYDEKSCLGSHRPSHLHWHKGGEKQFVNNSTWEKNWWTYEVVLSITNSALASPFAFFPLLLPPLYASVCVDMPRTQQRSMKPEI